MRPPLCTICLPSREKFDLLKKAIQSCWGSALGDDYNVVVRLDYDDAESLKRIPELSDWPNVRVIVGRRLEGYRSLGHFTTEAAILGQGKWICTMNDDATIEGSNWLGKLRAVEGNVIVQPEWHVLDLSRYHHDAAGPVGWFPNRCWEVGGQDEIPPAPDVHLDMLLRTDAGWPVHFLEGITVNHQHQPAWMQKPEKTAKQRAEILSASLEKAGFFETHDNGRRMGLRERLAKVGMLS